MSDLLQNPPLLRVEKLRVTLPSSGDRPYAVSDMNLSVAKGEILCVVGESGSGKSVTAQAIMGLLPPSLNIASGKIIFEGQDILGLSSERRRRITGSKIAMIFQEPIAALNPVYRVGDLVSEVFRTHTNLDRKTVRQKVLAIFDEVRLPDPEVIYKKYPHQLSGGQCQRVMIAMALALNPQILIADEPTTALDVTTQAQILKLIMELREHHQTGVIFITHDFGVVADIADRIAVMEKGDLVEIGTREEILDNPQHPYTRKLLNAVPRLEPRIRRAFSGTPIVEARNVCKVYGTAGRWLTGNKELRAVDDISLEIHAGETVGVVGESGSGKSTLAECMIRLREPTGGNIIIDGVEFSSLTKNDLREQRRNVQIVFQDPYTALDPRQTAANAIAEGPIIHGENPSIARQRALQLIEEVGLDPATADRYPHEFSGGQRQRLCIARALALEPKFLIADESVSALDVSIQGQILDLLAKAQETHNFAMLFITHDLRVAARVCDRTAVMRKGQLVEIETAEALFRAPKDDYTRLLLDAVPGKRWSALSNAPVVGASI
ncbi:ABC transporter ATP-binding protein [Brucellaceae bacterium D45D]